MSVSLILGSAATVWEDVVRLEALVGQWVYGPVVACNDMIHLWPRPLDHAVSRHAERLPEWIQKRKDQGPWGYRQQPFDVWTIEGTDVSHFSWTEPYAQSRIHRTGRAPVG